MPCERVYEEILSCKTLRFQLVSRGPPGSWHAARAILAYFQVAPSNHEDWEAVQRLLSSLLMRGIVANPYIAFAQERACSTVIPFPQSHLLGSFGGVQPYRKAMASWNADLCKVKPWSVSGRTVSQVEAPFPLARSTALCSESGRRSYRSSASPALISLFCLVMVALLCSCSAMIL